MEKNGKNLFLWPDAFIDNFYTYRICDFSDWLFQSDASCVFQIELIIESLFLLCVTIRVTIECEKCWKQNKHQLNDSNKNF